MATIITRSSLNRPLTNAEGDANFTSLNIEKLERNGTIPMTGDLQAPGIKYTNSTTGFTIKNTSGSEIFSLGKGNSDDLIIKGSINVGGESSELNLEGNISAKNIFLSGRLISGELTGQYAVEKIGDSYLGIGSLVNGKLEITIDVIIKIVERAGNFSVGQDISFTQLGTSLGTLTRVDRNTLYVRLGPNFTGQFQPGQQIYQLGTNGSVTGKISQIISNFKIRKDLKLKVFGVSYSTDGNIDPITVNNISLLKTESESSSNNVYRYWIAQFNFLNGQISRAERISGSISHKSLNNFNEQNFIKIQNIIRTNANHGILIYRSIDNDNSSSARLIDVLGPYDLGDSVSGIDYLDYGTYSVTGWSKKDSEGRFSDSSEIIHFPLSPNTTTSRKGWKTLTVDSVIGYNKIRMVENNIQLNSGSSPIVEFVHDNTAGLQKAINDNRDLGLGGITFPNGVYYTSRLNVPNDFEILGTGKLTIIKKIPWDFTYHPITSDNNKGNLFIPQEKDEPKNIYFRNLQIDGNLANNVKFKELESNYISYFKEGENINFDNVIITDVSGGGLYLDGVIGLRIQNCEIKNGSITYRGNDFSPIRCSESQNITINSNVFENFLSPVDVSVSRNGVVIGNTIKNCGSGLLVYASGNLLSSPNLIMGLDSEWIPTPDTMDSDFNSVNITINPGVGYVSPSFLYVSRGDPIYLGSMDKLGLPGSAVELSSDIFVLTKLNNSEIQKTEWDYSINTNNNQQIINIISPDEGLQGRNDGYFQFEIPGNNTTFLPNLSELITTHGNNLVSGEKIVGLVYRIKATGYTYIDQGERINILNGTFSTSGGQNFYTITLSNINDFNLFTVGNKVKLFEHNSSPNINNIEYNVVEKITSGLNRQIRIGLGSSSLGTTTNGQATGYIAIRKTVIIAKGRIL
jgi:hypothetical protein